MINFDEDLVLRYRKIVIVTLLGYNKTDCDIFKITK